MDSLEPQIQVLHGGRFLELVQAGRWEYARRVRSVSAVGVIAVTDQRELIVVEQYRIPVAARTLELPAGLVGDQQHLSGEHMLQAAKRELLEETGYEADQWTYLFDGPSSAGLTDEMVHLYLARGLRQTASGGGEETENITVHKIALDGLDAFLNAQRMAGVLVDMKIRMAGYLLDRRG